jgi:hypothetical protein
LCRWVTAQPPSAACTACCCALCVRALAAVRLAFRHPVCVGRGCVPCARFRFPGPARVPWSCWGRAVCPVVPAQMDHWASFPAFKPSGHLVFFNNTVRAVVRRMRPPTAPHGGPSDCPQLVPSRMLRLQSVRPTPDPPVPRPVCGIGHSFLQDKPGVAHSVISVLADNNIKSVLSVCARWSLAGAVLLLLYPLRTPPPPTHTLRFLACSRLVGVGTSPACVLVRLFVCVGVGWCGCAAASRT